MTGHVYRRLFFVWIALISLLLLSFGSAHLNLGTWNGVINLGIAAVKALLVALFFMHLKSGPALLRMTIALAVFMLVILFGLSHADYATRLVTPALLQPPPPSAGGK